MRIALVLSLASLAATGLGCADECTSAGDCTASQTCTEGSCVAVSTRPPPTTNFADAAMDATVVIPPFADASDAADATDTGQVGPDTGVEPGDGGDAGVAEAGVVERTGIVELTSLVGSSSTSVRTVARFIGFDPPTLSTPYTDAQSRCVVVSRLASNGSGTGIGGGTITVSGFNAGPNPADVLLSTAPATRGIFTAAAEPTVVWSSNETLRYTFAASTEAGFLTGATTTLSGAMPAETSIVGPVQAMPLLMSAAGPWTFDGNSVAAGIGLRAELIDARRGVTLSCEPVNGARLQVSAAARIAFTNAGAVAPYRLDIFYERRTAVMVPLVGGGTIDTTIRHVSGLRYRVQ